MEVVKKKKKKKLPFSFSSPLSSAVADVNAVTDNTIAEFLHIVALNRNLTCHGMSALELDFIKSTCLESKHDLIKQVKNIHF